MAVYYYDMTGEVFADTEDLDSKYWEPGLEVADLDRCPGGLFIQSGLSGSTVRPSLDFETYSAAGFNVDVEAKTVKGVVVQANGTTKGGLPVVGTPVYAEHPSTEILCLYYDMKDGKGRQAYIPGLTPDPVDLLEHIARGGMVEAFNITFEFWIWNMVAVRRLGWPVLTLEQCVCVMARSRRFGLPGSLAASASVIGGVQKDKEGGQLIQKLCRPHKPTKNRAEFRRLPWTDWDLFVGLYKYCEGDVKAEDYVAAHIPDLTPYERATWLADQTINLRGVAVDVETLDAALHIQQQMTDRFRLELAQITHGSVNTESEVEKMREFLALRGEHLPDMQAETVDEALKGAGFMDPAAVRVLEIRKALAGANIRKLPTLKRQLSSDGRLRAQYMYCGADRTGRWSAGGVQMQNLTAKGPKSKQCNECGHIVGHAYKGDCPECMLGGFVALDDWTVDAVEYAIQDIRSRDLDRVINIWGDPATLLAGCLRGLFVSAPGKKLICCDFSAIEAVVLACLSRCQWRIDVFNTHGKIYEMSASKISGVPFEEMLAYKVQNNHDHPLRKSLGKVAELASGYAGWIGAWKNFGAEKHFPDDAAIKDAILSWREASPEIVEFWGGQHRQVGAKPWDSEPCLFGLEGAAVAACMRPGNWYDVGDVSFGQFKDVLYCRLPSGRFLHYHRPRLVPTQDKLRRDILMITFEGWNSDPKRGPKGWKRLDTYGGRLCENITQAVAADIQAEALVRLEARGYPVVMHTHDEASAELWAHEGSVEDMQAVMSERPAWAHWWPIRAAGWTHTRYQKD